MSRVAVLIAAAACVASVARADGPRGPAARTADARHAEHGRAREAPAPREVGTAREASAPREPARHVELPRAGRRRAPRPPPPPCLATPVTLVRVDPYRHEHEARAISLTRCNGRA